jgi:hypothetical protein
MSDGAKFPMFGDDWRCRWLVFADWKRLHRVATIEWEDGDRISGQAVSACGRSGRMSMPGLFSRMGLTRCHKCCTAAGVPLGDGAPHNAGIKEPA